MFADAFDAFSSDAPSPERADEIRDLFSRICDIKRGSGVTYISGWLAFFSVFDVNGKWILRSPTPYNKQGLDIFGKKHGEIVWIPRIEMQDIPPAYGEVDVELNDNGVGSHTTMVAGFVGYKILGEKRDTVAPYTGWWMFVKQ